jgi:deazaflavin-dependent oxidoreductase (nitroreductase family)
MMSKIFIWLNIFFYRLTGGTLGGKMGDSTVLLLTTTGRKTGKQRTVPLRYLRHEDGYMIVASNWGMVKPPAWFNNLLANPTVNIQVMGTRMTARAEIASEAQRPPLYQEFINADPRFIEYENTAKPRTIAVVLLHPQT